MSSPPARNTLHAGLIAVALVLAYANTFAVPFVFDDVAAITQNPSIEHFSTALSPPAALSVTGRPLVNLSLALNHAISGRNVWSYHALNLTLHIGCALALFGIIRRTLRLRWTATSGRRLAASEDQTRPEVAFHLDPTGIAFTATLLWSLHPLQTAAVTYIMQRSELLVSLCFVLTLYCFTRRWLVASVIVCACGMAAKEVMASAPVIILLYDRTFITGSFRAALRARPGYYAALAATWFILAALLFGTDSRGDSAGFASAIPWSDYATTQLYAFGHYLRLIVWPVPLIFDYGSVLTRDPASILAGTIALLALVGATVFALRRYPAIGFCGVTFLALLAPTTSIVPIATQTIAEHRLYLALALPLVLLIVAAHRFVRQSGMVVAVAASLAFCAITFARNTDYRSPVSLWADTVAKQPANARAHYNLAISLLASGTAADTTRALAELRETLRLEPQHAPANQKLGSLLVAADRAPEALPFLETAVRVQPNSASAHNDLALALARLRRTKDAVAHFAEAVRLDPRHAAARYNFGNALAELGRYEEALAAFEEAARLDPDDKSARNNAARIREYLRK